MGDSDSLKVGQWVMAIGNPFDLPQTVTVGVVSGKKRQNQIGTSVSALAPFIQTDAAINFGNSGGPLIDGQGRVIGINTAIQRGEMAEGIGFAIPINEARKAAEELKSGGSVKHGYLGITMNTTSIDEKSMSYYKLPDTNGVIVAGVSPDGPAEKAGVRPNDVIRKIDGNTVKDNQELLGMIASRKPGDTVKLEVVRGGETKKIDIKLTTRPDFDALGQENESKPDDDSAVPSSGEGLGIKVQALPTNLRRSLGLGADAPGVMILEVDPESDAAEAGLSPHQVVTAIDDKPVKSVAEWNRIVKGLKPGETVKLDLSIFGGRTARNEIVFLTVPKPDSK
jgi:serine protease Do